MKLQGSTEYILILAGVIIVIIAGLVFVLKTGGTATKSSGLQAELLSAEQVGANSIAFATNLQLPINSTSNAVNIRYNNDNTSGNFSITGPYKVAGGYEYEITNIKALQQSSSSSSNTIYIVPITITNNQNTPTGTYQQSITLQESNFANYITYNGNIANFYFEYPNGEHIPAWIESNNSGVLTIFFKLNNVPATSNTIVNLVFVNKTTNELNNSGTTGIGEAPNFSSSYGEFDDGPSVFNFYNNFAGTSLNTNLWSYSTSGTGSITVNNGVSLYSGTSPTSDYSYANIYTNNIILSNVIIESLINLYGDRSINCARIRPMEYGYYRTIIPGTSIGGSYMDYGIFGQGSKTYPQYYFGHRFTNVYPPISSSPTIYDILDSWTFPSSGNLTWAEYNYPSMTAIKTFSASFTNGASFPITYLIDDDCTPIGTYLNIEWVRTRTYPPNGIMPSYTFGPTKIIQSSSSTQQPISSISSITYTDINGNKVTLLPTSGTSISVIPNGSFPFTISQIT
ncbi:MAG: DUF2341 domain-containing protein [Candidatus Parvarchaeota archaeon]